MRWISTTSGFTAMVGEDAAGTVTFERDKWIAISVGGARSEFSSIEAAKAWLETEISGD